MKRLGRASCHDDPLKMARDFADEAAEEESRDTKSILGDHAEFCRGNEKAIPGYDRM